MSATSPLPSEAVAQARARGMSAGKLPPDVLERFAILWAAQANLRDNVRRASWATLDESPSAWTLRHLVPLVGLMYADRLRQRPQTHARSYSEGRLRGWADRLRQGDVLGPLDEALAFAVAGEGSREARQLVRMLVRLLDFGVLGLDLVAAVVAEHEGLKYLPALLVSEGGLNAAEAMNAAADALGEPRGHGPAGAPVGWLLAELLPDEFDAIGVEGVTPVRGRPEDHDFAQ